MKKRAYSLKGLGRRGLSLLMAMVMTLSLVQISAFATDGEENDTLKPQAVADNNGHNITLSKTAERVGDTEWKVTVKADIGETPIKQQPLDVVFVLDRSGSMAWCTEEPHEHSDSCYQLKADADPEHKHGWREYDFFGNFYPSSCPNYELACGHYYEEEHEHSGNTTCYYKETKDSEWTAYPSRLSAAKSAMSTLEGNLPNGANVQYVSFSSNAKQENSLNDVVANGGTNIMKGVNLGIDLLNKNQSTVTKKVLVLLSDGKDDNGNYSSKKLKNFNGDVYTVGFAVDNQNLKGMIKGDGKYIYAKNAEALDSAFTELSTRIAAMIVDPMGDKVTYVDGSAEVSEGSVAGSISVDTDGRTLRWTPTNQDKFNNSTIEYTYNVKLNPSEENGDYTDIKLNNTTYLQYGVEEQNGVKNAYTANFPIPAGYYKVSNLTEKFVDENGTDISQYVEQPHTFFQSKVTDNGLTELVVNAPAKTLDTNDEHVKYLYVSSTLDKADYAYNVDSDGNYVDGSLNVTDEAKAHELVHVYERATVNSVEYVYDGDIPEDATKLTDGYAKTWYPTGTTGIEVQPDAESKQYNFSGWEKISGEAEVVTDENGYAVPESTFTLTAPEGDVPAGDVVFQGQWTLKPSYQIVADYYIITDGGDRVKKNTTPMPLTEVEYEINADPVSYTAGSSTYESKTYDEVELSQGQEQLEGLNWDAGTSTVSNIIPTQGTTVVHLDYIRHEKSDASYIVKHEYYNVVSDGEPQAVTEDNYSTDVITAKHDDSIAVTDAMKDSTANSKHAQGYYEYVSDNGPISLDKAETKNLTIRYNHYQYVVTTQGDAGVASLTGADTYNKGDNAQVSFTLNEGYQVKSVTDNGNDVTAQAKSGTYNIANIDKNHTVVVTTEKIKYTLSVQYIFPEGQKPATGFENYNVSLDYGTQYDSYVKAVAAPAGYTRTDSGNTTGVITGNTTVLFLYVPNGNATVNVYYQREDDHMSLLSPKSQSGRIGTSFDVTSWKIDSITDGGKIYDLVDGAEHGKDAVMTGEYKLGGTNIYLYYTERAKANITIKYQSEDGNKATFTKEDYTAQGYLNTQYNISGTTYLPETITETLADGSTRTWYYSGSDKLVPGKEALTGTLTGDITVVAKYYLKPTYSVTATYTTVSNGVSSNQTDAAAKQTGEAGQNVPFDLSTYVVKYGFTSSNYQNDLSVNGKPASEMPVMEKFGDYAVTLSYKKSVNSGVSTTIQHEFKTFVDGVETLDTTTAPDDAVTETWGKTVDMSKFSKAGQAGYEGYTVEKYSAENGQLRAGDKGTITYVRNLVSVVFDLSGGTWNNSLNNVNYNVVKGGSLDKDGQQPIPAPTKDGFKFAGWTAQPENAIPTGKFDQRTVFTAKWEQEIVVTKSYFYTVTYNYTVTTDGTVTYQDSETTQVQDTTKASQTINASATASHGGYTFDLASPAEQTADLTGTTREAPHQFVVNYVLTVNNGGGGRDDRDDDRPAPKPDPDTEIKDDDVPKSDLPEQPVEIPDEDTPKADLPQAPVDIPDEDTPKADVPKTGDAMGLWVMAAAASGAGLIWLNLTGKKRKDDNG
ncbi:vWA domain-containing protein [Flintibacter faecis]|uniref:VWA domain-containing protein n=1 Tax=Flintibacter faecis TaxID=2763047 RepID=A0A8J6M560_9FIRM|nr:vWA domain-containing protein [Flintibacter faecis]MBC5716476.1 VWA domain-containing protein [Flintibacter faecis]